MKICHVGLRSVLAEWQCIPWHDKAAAENVSDQYFQVQLAIFNFQHLTSASLSQSKLGSQHTVICQFGYCQSCCRNSTRPQSASIPYPPPHKGRRHKLIPLTTIERSLSSYTTSSTLSSMVMHIVQPWQRLWQQQAHLKVME